MYQFLSIDFLPLITILATSLSCSLIGAFLLVRRQSLMGDALSHAVLPGIVLAFIFTSSRNSIPVFIGAALAALIASLCIELITRLTRIEPGAAMGVVFSLFFALGVLLIETASARGVDIDASCLLEGQLETLFWFPPTSSTQFFSGATFNQIPGEVLISIVTLFVTGALTFLLFKEFLIIAFDAAHATALGLSTKWINFLFIATVAGVIVSSFKIVGSIIVIGLLVCPAASSRILFSSLKNYLIGTLVISAVCSVGGYFLGAVVPALFGAPWSLSASGSIAALCGLSIAVATIFSKIVDAKSKSSISQTFDSSSVSSAS